MTPVTDFYDDCDMMDAELPEPCWYCLGAGGWHDCGDDCCPCLDPEINEECPECNGTGSV